MNEENFFAMAAASREVFEGRWSVYLCAGLSISLPYDRLVSEHKSDFNEAEKQGSERLEQCAFICG